MHIKKRRLFPGWYAGSVEDVTEGFLHSLGVKALLLDIDNTLSHVDAPNAETFAANWMARMKKAGFLLALVSNNDPERVEPFAAKCALPYVCHAQKPQPDGYRTLAGTLGVRPEECLAIGDQLFTDIWGGNAAGTRTLLVRPLSEDNEPAQFRKRRRLEKILLKIDAPFTAKRRAQNGEKEIKQHGKNVSHRL